MARTRALDLDDGPDSRQFVTALARGMTLLACFQPDDTWLTNSELAARTGLPRPTVVRLAYTLCVLGYLRQSADTGHYAIGDAMVALGATMVSQLRLRRVARPYLQRLAEQYDTPVSLGIRNGLNMVYVEHCRSAAPLSLGLDLGARLPVATSAMGRAFLCVADEREREALLVDIRQAAGDDWPRQQAGIESAREHWRLHGFTLSIRDWERDISGVGAAIRLDDGKVIAFNVGGAASRLPRALLEQDVGPQLARMVRELATLVRGSR